MAAYTDHLEHTNIYNRDLDDSEESDGEGGFGNLNRLIVRPPGHSGKAKRGQLCFDAAFECGNLGRADHITELEYDLFIRPDTCRPRSRFWFNFTVENVKQDQRVIFNFVNMGKEHTLFETDMTPLVRSTSRQKWQRIPRRLIFYHRSIIHRGRKVFSIAFAFDREEDVYHFVASAPYSYSRLQKYLTAWENRAQAFATRESIATTTQKRRIDLLTIGDFNLKEKEVSEEHQHSKSKVVEPKKRVVIIIARSHGGEAPSSFVCQGFLDYILSSSEKSCALRNGIVIQVIPMLNPDGVFLGNHRSDLLGSDLNRCWNKSTSYSHPALVAVNDMVKKLACEKHPYPSKPERSNAHIGGSNKYGGSISLDELFHKSSTASNLPTKIKLLLTLKDRTSITVFRFCKGVQLDFILDLHADVSHEGVFVRGNSYDDVFRFERHAVLPKFLGARIEAWQPENCLFNTDLNLTGSARRTLPTGLADAYSLKVSMGGRRLSLKGPYIHYTEDTYAKVGRSLVKALCDYYRHIGVIPPRVPVSKKDSRGRRRRRRPPRGRERSPSTSPERRVLPARVLSPPLPPASPPALRAPPPRLTRHHALRSRPRNVHDIDHMLPIVTGIAVPPRLAVVDLSAHIRTPAKFGARRAPILGARIARPPRPSHGRFTSDEYDTHDSDS